MLYNKQTKKSATQTSGNGEIMNIFVCRVDKFPRNYENVLSGVMGFKIRCEASELTLLLCITILA